MKQERLPPRREVEEVAPGVLRAQLPVWFTGLGHVNMYVLEDRRGVAVIDPGLPGPATWRAIKRAMKQIGIPVGRIHTVLVTHSHPDHFGGVPRLLKRTGANMLTHRSFRAWWSPHPADDWEPGQAGDRLRMPWRGGTYQWTAQQRMLRPAFRYLAARVEPPLPTRTVEDGDRITLADRDWLAVHTPGHTADHLCLYDPDKGTLISGDHVLPTITPHISGMSRDPDPLKAYLSSLDKVVGLGDVSHVLPAHGHPFKDLSGRVEDIKEHHAERVDRLRQALAALGPTTVQELARQIFPQKSWGFMAENETYAHLEHLRLAGEAEQFESGGDLRYRIA